MINLDSITNESNKKHYEMPYEWPYIYLIILTEI